MRVFPWLAISTKADPGEVQAGQPVTDSKRSDSVELCLQRSIILGRLSLSSLWILPPPLIPPHSLVPFMALIQFLTCTGMEKTVGFSGCLHLLRLSGIWSDFLSQISLNRSSDPHGHSSCLERQDKGMRL